MASRTKQKEQARARRIAEEQARAERTRRRRRLQTLGGVVILAIVVVVVAVIASSGEGNNGAASASRLARQVARTGKTCQGQDAPICNLLSGIPEHGNTLGSPTAEVSVVEYGDLECPICRDFALSSENQLISNDVRSGKVKLTYKSLETATEGAPDPSIFGPQQAAAYAAGLQDRAWYYIELFYHQQGPEDTAYANRRYFDNLAKQVPGLNYSEWLSASKNSSLNSQVITENRKAIPYLIRLGATSQGRVSTPTILITGPKGQATPIVGDPQSYAELASEINQVS